MYALHLAVNAIKNNDCDSAVVAGTQLILGPETQISCARLGAISPTSTCHTFDASADGYARAEGFGALYIKRLSDAVAHGDPIRAVIRGTAANTWVQYLLSLSKRLTIWQKWSDGGDRSP